MIRKTTHKVLWPALGAAILGVTLAGCGSNATDNTAATTPDTTTTAPDASTQNTAPATGNESAGEAAPAEIAAFFPSATLTKKAFPMDAEAASHMSEGSGVKFSGEEKEWEVYEASQNGQRVGLAVMTHSDLPDGGDMHIAFAVDKNFKITQTAVSEAPDVAKMKTFIAQTVGKTHDAAFKVGKDLKAPAGLSPQVAQIAADAVHKGVLILEENFNPLHGEAAGHAADDGHGH